jgi:hypothetical protein
MCSGIEFEFRAQEPDWLTVNVWPAIVSVPLRPRPFLRSATLKVTVPLPLSVDTPVIVNHSSFELAVQLHCGPLVVTVTVPLPPDALTLWLVGVMVNEQGEVPSCVTLNACPATVSVPVRVAPRFGSTMKATDPLPVPDAPEVTTSHAALEAAVHEHEPPVVTATDPVPPTTATF